MFDFNPPLRCHAAKVNLEREREKRRGVFLFAILDDTRYSLAFRLSLTFIEIIGLNNNKYAYYYPYNKIRQLASCNLSEN